MDILYSHALDAEGNRRSVKEVDAAAPFRCGDCENEMITKRGKVRRWHFSHKAQVECIPRPDPDNMLHRVGQDIIVRTFNESVANGTPYEILTRCTGLPGVPSENAISMASPRDVKSSTGRIWTPAGLCPGCPSITIIVRAFGFV